MGKTGRQVGGGRATWPHGAEFQASLRHAQRGEPGALDTLLARLRPWFLQFFTREFDRDTAEDLTQEALLGVLRALPRLDPARASGYVERVARYRLRWASRGRARDARRYAPLQAALRIPSPARADQAAEYADLVRAAAALPPRARACVLETLGGLSPADIAALHGLSPTTVRRHLERARSSLQAALGVRAAAPSAPRQLPGAPPRQVRETGRLPYAIERFPELRTMGGREGECAARADAELRWRRAPRPGRRTRAPRARGRNGERGMRTAAIARETRERVGDMMARYLGPTILAAFADDDVTEIYLNPQDGVVRFDTRSRGRVDSGARLDAARVEMFLNAVAASLGRTLGADAPRLEAELPALAFRGSRLQGFASPVTAGPAFNIRKPPAVIYSLDDFVRAGSLSPSQRDTLRRAVRDHRNILIAGGTNTGKTTLANALLRAITELCPGERIVLLEDTVELQCAAPDHLALRTGPGVTLAQLVQSALRTSPSRIVVGEVRGPEALDLLDAWATGHPGGIATVHASSARGALLRLDRLAQRANVPPQQALIVEAIHLVVLIAGSNAGRRVTDLVSVAGIDAAGALVFDRPLPRSVSRSGVSP